MSDKLCAVVGVGPGIGIAVARRFARENYRLALIARNPEKLEQYVDELDLKGITARGFVADAGKPQSLVRAFYEIQRTMGHPDVLIYNAAIIRQRVPSELDADALMSDLSINVAGALTSAQQVIPHMREQQQGTILFTGGGLALGPAPQYASLAMGKAALRNLTYSLSSELESEGIQVATVTIAGYVQPGTHFDPDRIAEAFWTLHSQPPGQREPEIIYK
jgi:NAD(P)-dependent dehydrogenase (short-subunit alcohol dehydrogenase family)